MSEGERGGGGGGGEGEGERERERGEREKELEYHVYNDKCLVLVAKFKHLHNIFSILEMTAHAD